MATDEKNLARYTLRVDKMLYRKFAYIADYNGRSINREIERYFRRLVESFEAEHGEIKLEDE